MKRELTLSQAIEAYSLHQAARGDSETHRKECRRTLGAFVSCCGDLPAAGVRPDELRVFMNELRSRPGLGGRERLSDLTLAAYHRVLAAFFRFLETEGHVEASPMRAVPRPKTRLQLIRPFSEEQLRRLIAQPDPASFIGLRDRTLMVFLADTGCRISECLGITYTDLDLDARTVRVLGKGARERMVPFGERTRQWLEAYLARRRESELSDRIFVNEFGEPLTRGTVARRFAGYGRQAGIRGVRVSPHTFRHTFAVQWLLGSGDYKGDALSLQRILGHSTPAMTQRYVHLTSGDLGRLHARLSPADKLSEAPPQVGRRRRLR
ncbi:MAG: tyrosine-type recombinase/integrase [Armatimonadota bacterium]